MGVVDLYQVVSCEGGAPIPIEANSLLKAAKIYLGSENVERALDGHWDCKVMKYKYNSSLNAMFLVSSVYFKYK